MEISTFWNNFNQDLSENLVYLENIKEQSPIRRIPLFECTFYEGYFDLAFETFKMLEGEEKDKWLFAMLPSKDGYRDYSKFWEDVVYLDDYTATSKVNLKNNHHYQTYQKLGKKPINEYNRIVEFGGGCGDMARFVMDMGFNGEYVMVDIPSSLEIQKHLLSNFTNITYTSEILHYEPNTLLISTWSISESPIEWRSKFMVNLMPEGWLITYQRYWSQEDLNNVEYFDNWRGEREDISFLPWDGGSQYIIF